MSAGSRRLFGCSRKRYTTQRQSFGDDRLKDEERRREVGEKGRGKGTKKLRLFRATKKWNGEKRTEGKKPLAT